MVVGFVGVGVLLPVEDARRRLLTWNGCSREGCPANQSYWKLLFYFLQIPFLLLFMRKSQGAFWLLRLPEFLWLT